MEIGRLEQAGYLDQPPSGALSSRTRSCLSDYRGEPLRKTSCVGLLHVHMCAYIHMNMNVHAHGESVGHAWGLE